MKEWKQIAVIFCCFAIVACSETKQASGVEDAKAAHETVIPDSSAKSLEQSSQYPAEDAEESQETVIPDSSAKSLEQSSQNPAEDVEESQKTDEGLPEKQ